ncbi:MAG: cytochrome c nitrite reductase small subunit [Ignavibacteria bacterium]|jgi:cytochrome c nitrite reductase small subunit|nr:cytochrome c nitrite reductase small subunit [Ignavibacteria bacterium]
MNKFGRLIHHIIPPDNWKLPVILILGVLTGLVILVFHVANGTSYLSDKPETCVNCHVMFPQYASWQHSSHARVATCNDCHVPQDNVIRKYFFKASDGLRHTTMFTLRLEPQVIQIKNAGKYAVQENCERCHEGLLGYMHSAQKNKGYIVADGKDFCWSCHQEVPHGTVSSLSAFPNAKVPQLSPVLPEWLDKALNK